MLCNIPFACHSSPQTHTRSLLKGCVSEFLYLQAVSYMDALCLLLIMNNLLLAAFTESNCPDQTLVPALGSYSACVFLQKQAAVQGHPSSPLGHTVLVAVAPKCFWDNTGAVLTVWLKAICNLWIYRGHFFQSHFVCPGGFLMLVVFAHAQLWLWPYMSQHHFPVSFAEALNPATFMSVWSLLASTDYGMTCRQWSCTVAGSGPLL